MTPTLLRSVDGVTSASIGAIGLALGSAVLHAVWNLLIKTTDDRDLALAAQFAMGGLLAVVGLVVVGLPGWDAAPFLVASALIHVVYATGLAKAYEVGDFSLTYPLARAGGATLAAIGGVAILGDAVSVGAWIAIAVVALGVASAIGPHPSRAALMWCLVTAISIATYTLTDSHGARVSVSGVSYGFAVMAATSVTVVTTAVVRRGAPSMVRVIRAEPWRPLVGGACATGAYALVLVAVRHAPVGQVAMLRESSVVFGALGGWLWLREALGRRRFLSSCVMVVGLVALVVVSTGCSGADRAKEASTPGPSSGSGAARSVGDADDLYRFEEPAPDVEHGKLLRYQRLERGFPGGGPTYRVVYASRSMSGEPIYVTGTVHLPAGQPPAEGWRTIAWAHGTTGSADRCAPSRTMDYPSAAESMVDRGYVIASTDYEGLGTPGLHPYLVGPSEGRGVLDIVRAAAELPGARLDGRVALWGHSQGGHAAVHAHQLAATWTPELSIVGTVAIAPPALMTLIMPAVSRFPNKGFAVMGIAGGAAAYPDIDLATILTPPARDRMGVLETGCTDAVDDAYRDLDTILLDGAEQRPEVVRHLRESEPGTVAAAAPALVVQGDADTTVPPVLNAQMKQNWCATGQNVTRWVVPGATHRTVLDQVPAMEAWTVDRFEGKAVASGCGSPDGPPPSGG